MRFLFVGFNHSIGDPRLFYRQMIVVKEDRPDVDLVFWTSSYKTAFVDDASNLPVDVQIQNPSSQVRPVPDLHHLPRVPRGLLRRWHWLRIAVQTTVVRLQALRREPPDLLQASDARELPFALLAKWVSGCTVIYDSHEDYFNQVYEYQGKTKTALLKAWWLWLKEVAFARGCDHVFVTSIAHAATYEDGPYGIDSVHVLPNYAPAHLAPPLPEYEPTSTLRLVYVGSVNQYRGVTETAHYCRQFNDRHGPDRTLAFHYVGNPHPLVDDLAQEGLICDDGPLPYPEMMQALQQYDVGTCLLHDIEKFRTSVPVKNFDYMAAGLPVVTSNFGEMLRYVDAADAGFCIDPMSYDAFEEALLALFDPATRRRYGESGHAYATGPASFEAEAAVYRRVVSDALSTRESAPLNEA